MPIDSDVSSGYSSATGSSSTHTSYSTSGADGSTSTEDGVDARSSSRSDFGTDHTSYDEKNFDSIYSDGSSLHDASETANSESVFNPNHWSSNAAAGNDFYNPAYDFGNGLDFAANADTASELDFDQGLIRTSLGNSQIVFVDPAGLPADTLATYRALRQAEAERTAAIDRVALEYGGLPDMGGMLSQARNEAERARQAREAFETEHFGIDHGLNLSMDTVHTALDVAGLSPGIGIVFDVTNAVTFVVVDGDYVNAGISLGAIIPAGGQLIAGARLSNKVVDAAKRIDGTIEASIKYPDGATIHVAKRADGTVSNIVERADGSLVFTHVDKVNGRYPINSGYAGRTHPSGVQFKENGFPDFTPFARESVEVPGLTGNIRKDARLANQKAGFTDTPADHTWHHVEDTNTMQLVPRKVHKAAGHTGGAAILRGRGE